MAINWGRVAPSFIVLAIMVMMNLTSGRPSPPETDTDTDRRAWMEERQPGGVDGTGNAGGMSGLRMERSANLSHITGTSRKIRMYIRNKYLQLVPDGGVNTTDDENSRFAILQRTSVDNGQVKIQGIATCAFLCMDACGFLYSSVDFDEECVFNEQIEQHFYNTYTSAKYSVDGRTLYVALTKRGTARKVQLKTGTPLGRFSSYAKILPQPVDGAAVAAIMADKFPGFDPERLRHHHLCPPAPHSTGSTDRGCRKQRKRKKQIKRNNNNNNNNNAKTRKYCKEEEEDSEECKTTDGPVKIPTMKKRVKNLNKKGKKKKKFQQQQESQEKTDEDDVTTVVPEMDYEFLDE